MLLVPTLQRGNTTLAVPAARLGDAGASRLAPTPERKSQMKSIRTGGNWGHSAAVDHE